MPLYINDYLGDTMHLSAEQHGAYLLLIMSAWKSDGRLPNDERVLANISRLPLASWRRSAPVILPFFQADGDWLRHKRVIEERAKAERMTAARRLNGGKGGRPRKLNGTEIEPSGKLQVIGSKS